MDYLLILGGLLLLFAGGEGLVRGSVGIARKLGVSELIIGLTLVGFGTSVPELVTSLRAIETDSVGIAVGNVLGSNVANILLVLGIAAILRPILTNPRALARDGMFMIAVTGVFAALVYFDLFTRPVGIALVVLLVVYMIVSILTDQRPNSQAAAVHSAEAEIVEATDAMWLAVVLALGGIAAVIFGARFLVDGASSVAKTFGVSDAIIGLSIVAVGTSLPELVTSAMAAIRGKSDVALGNILGSNIFNILGIMGITAIVHPFSVMVPATRAVADGKSILQDAVGQAADLVNLINWTDMGALFLSVFLLVLFAYTGKRIARWEGGVLIAAYLVYMGMLFGLLPTPFA